MSDEDMEAGLEAAADSLYDDNRDLREWVDELRAENEALRERVSDLSEDNQLLTIKLTDQVSDIKELKQREAELLIINKKLSDGYLRIRELLND